VNRSSVIVVAVTYRLGAFGFLWSGTDGFNGAYGIQDQRLALKWVQANIVAFGGNPSRVTIYGQSAGAGSVGVHLQSAESDPLFQQAILQR
jgi:carboxylesterase type B